MNKKTKLGIKILLAPFFLLALSFGMFAVAQLFGDSSAGEPSSFNVAVNIFLFVFGTLSVISFLPAIVVGTIFILDGKKHSTANKSPDKKSKFI